MEKRIPQQLRSMEKKQRILDRGLKVFSEKGYLHTTTADIAKAAEVSVGLVYLYFNDKRDILIQILESNAAKFLSPLRRLCDRQATSLPLKEMWTLIWNAYREIRASNEIDSDTLSIAHSDDEIRACFTDLKNRMADAIREILYNHGFRFSRPNERIFMAMGILNTLYRETKNSADEDKKVWENVALDTLCACFAIDSTAIDNK